MKVLFIDDNPVRCWRFMRKQRPAYLADNASDALEILIEYAPWDVMCLEYHIDDNTGEKADVIIEALQDMEKEDRPEIERIIIHTLDVGKAHKMIMDLQLLGYVNSEWIPFYKLEPMLPLN
jgi:hypothetical protein